MTCYGQDDVHPAVRGAFILLPRRHDSELNWRWSCHALLPKQSADARREIGHVPAA
jgi:hypothetical protein